MLRTVLTAIGIIEIVDLEGLIDAAERVALENPNECERRSWVLPGARVEGVVLLILMWRNDASYAVFKRFLGLIGSGRPGVSPRVQRLFHIARLYRRIEL